jgi:K+-transporting ATPase ATPase B chain
MSRHEPVRISIFSAELMGPAISSAFAKLDPRRLIRNPVMFTTAVVALLLTVLLVLGGGAGDLGFQVQLVFWLWLTVLFGNFAEALAEGRGKAQAASLRETKSQLMAKKLIGKGESEFQRIGASRLRAGDIVLVETGDLIPADGEVIEGVASVNEAAITGESAPVIREAGGDRSAVTAGTRVISDQIKVKVTQEPGEGFLDRMIALVEGAQRQKTPNEVALTVLLVGLTIIFLIAVATIPGFAAYSGGSIPVPLLVALLVALIPTTIAALLSAIGIAGMDRLVRFNVLAKSGRAVEASGDVDVLLLDKTGTITVGDRQASEFRPVSGVQVTTLAEAALLASLADETPEGRSIVTLARERFDVKLTALPDGAEVIPFSAKTRLSGVRADESLIQKGAVDSIFRANPETAIGAAASELRRMTDEIARSGMTPLAVARDGRLLGAVALKDVIKAGVRERFAELRRMGIRTVMITGDNPLTAASIAAEAGVDDFLAEATPEDKLALIRKEQAEGRLVAMCGDGTNDAPALAQADVGVTMNTGTQAAREAGNMVDLDSDPTKLIEIVGLGKQLLMTRGSLTTFSIANDIAKYFAIIPAMFAVLYPGLGVLNVMGLASQKSAVLSAIIFNAIVIPLLVPLALRGVTYRPIGAAALLVRNLSIYGLGGLVAPFIGIKLIDLAVNALGFA